MASAKPAPLDIAEDRTPEVLVTDGDTAEVPVEAHTRRAPSAPATGPSSRLADLEAELLRVQLAIVTTKGDMTGAHLTAAREYVQRVLGEVVEGKRKLSRELADHLAARITDPE